MVGGSELTQHFIPGEVSRHNNPEFSGPLVDYRITHMDRESIGRIIHDQWEPVTVTGHVQFPSEWPTELVWHYNLLAQIALWASDSSSREHIVPPPPRLNDLYNGHEIREAVMDLANYYNNNNEEPTFENPETGKVIPKLLPLVATNGGDRPLGVVTIRGRGDPNLGHAEGVAGIERLLTDPNFRNRGVGTSLMTEAHRMIFDEFGFNECRLWVMQTEGMSKLFKFYQDFGYSISKSEAGWLDYASQRNIDLQGDYREAYWFYLTREKYYARKKG